MLKHDPWAAAMKHELAANIKPIHSSLSTILRISELPYENSYI